MFKPRRDSFSGNRGGSGNFGGSRDRHGRNDRHFSGGGDRGGFDRDERPSFDAVCDQCGKACTVPFKPTGSRPVLCRQCFKNEGGGGSDRPSYRDRGNDRDSRRGGDSQMDTAGLEKQLKKINDRLDLILDALAPAAPPKKKEKAAKKNKKEKKPEVIEEEIVEEDAIEENAIDEDDDIDEDDEDFIDDEDPIDDEDSEDQST
jgi:CxxC-x17-CxxC domain-containing protein